MSDEQQPAPEAPQSHFPDLEELQEEIARRIRDNQKFLSTYLDDEMTVEMNDEVDEDEELPPEEL